MSVEMRYLAENVKTSPALPGPVIMIRVWGDDLNICTSFGPADKETTAMHKRFSGFTILPILLLLGLVLPSCQAQQDQHITAVSPSEAAELIAKHQGDTNFVILDIRTPGEYQSGHLERAVMIDYYSKSFVNEIDRLDKEKSYLVYCRSGNRSGRSMDLLKKLEFKKIYHLATGINGWISAGLPLVRQLPN